MDDCAGSVPTAIAAEEGRSLAGNGGNRAESQARDEERLQQKHVLSQEKAVWLQGRVNKLQRENDELHRSFQDLERDLQAIRERTSNFDQNWKLLHDLAVRSWGLLTVAQRRYLVVRGKLTTAEEAWDTHQKEHADEGPDEGGARSQCVLCDLRFPRNDLLPSLQWKAHGTEEPQVSTMGTKSSSARTSEIAEDTSQEDMTGDHATIGEVTLQEATRRALAGKNIRRQAFEDQTHMKDAGTQAVQAQPVTTSLSTSHCLVAELAKQRGANHVPTVAQACDQEDNCEEEEEEHSEDTASTATPTEEGGSMDGHADGQADLAEGSTEDDGKDKQTQFLQAQRPGFQCSSSSSSAAAMQPRQAYAAARPGARAGSKVVVAAAVVSDEKSKDERIRSLEARLLGLKFLSGPSLASAVQPQQVLAAARPASTRAPNFISAARCCRPSLRTRHV